MLEVKKTTVFGEVEIKYFHAHQFANAIDYMRENNKRFLNKEFKFINHGLAVVGYGWYQEGEKEYLFVNAETKSDILQMLMNTLPTAEWLVDQKLPATAMY